MTNLCSYNAFLLFTQKNDSGLQTSFKEEMKNYSPCQTIIQNADLSGYKNKVDTRKNWDDTLKNFFRVNHCIIHPQKGIVGNLTGTICIKSTKFGKLKYKEDQVKQETGFMYYETRETQGRWDDEIDNSSIKLSHTRDQGFLVFEGSNAQLKFLGVGKVVEIFVATINSGRSAIFKIKLY